MKNELVPGRIVKNNGEFLLVDLDGYGLVNIENRFSASRLDGTGGYLFNMADIKFECAGYTGCSHINCKHTNCQHHQKNIMPDTPDTQNIHGLDDATTPSGMAAC